MAPELLKNVDDLPRVTTKETDVYAFSMVTLEVRDLLFRLGIFFGNPQRSRRLCPCCLFWPCHNIFKLSLAHLLYQLCSDPDGETALSSTGPRFQSRVACAGRKTAWTIKLLGGNLHRFYVETVGWLLGPGPGKQAGHGDCRSAFGIYVILIPILVFCSRFVAFTCSLMLSTLISHALCIILSASASPSCYPRAIPYLILSWP